jgi:hypothetical protein
VSSNDEDDTDDEPTTATSRTGHALRRPGVTPPRPPRRTGVFLDADDLREHVGALLRAILGGYEVDGYGNYTFAYESARVFVTVSGSARSVRRSACSRSPTWTST